MLLEELLFGAGERAYFGVDGKTEITRPFCDSRESVRGGLFVCLKGQETDGHLYAAAAVDNGAAAVACEKRIEGLPCVVVGDTRFLAAVLWNNYYKRPAESLRLIGITGTNGKTSTAAFLSACLREAGRRVGTIGTLGSFFENERMGNGEWSEKQEMPCSMTTPDPRYLYGELNRFRALGADDVVMEVSSHAIALRKTDAAAFQAGVFTNLTPEHLDAHGSMEEYFRVKSSFVARCERRIVNEDDPECRRFAAAVPSALVGMKNVRDLKVGNDGVSYTLCHKGDRLRIVCPVGGGFTVYNTLLSAVTALELGAPSECIERGIASVESVRGRMERVAKREEWGFDVICDYAHTPAALESLLCHLKRNTRGKLICVFGCGGDRDKTKRPKMGRIAECICDGVIITSDNSRTEDTLSIIRDIIAGMTGDNSVVIPDRKEAVFAAVAMAREGDTVALCGKGHESYEIVGSAKRPFDERKIVEEALKMKYGK